MFDEFKKTKDQNGKSCDDLLVILNIAKQHYDFEKTLRLINFVYPGFERKVNDAVQQEFRKNGKRYTSSGEIKELQESMVRNYITSTILELKQMCNEYKEFIKENTESPNTIYGSSFFSKITGGKISFNGKTIKRKTNKKRK
jgi:hypothetical protein